MVRLASRVQASSRTFRVFSPSLQIRPQKQNSEFPNLQSGASPFQQDSRDIELTVQSSWLGDPLEEIERQRVGASVPDPVKIIGSYIHQGAGSHVGRIAIHRDLACAFGDQDDLLVGVSVRWMWLLACFKHHTADEKALEPGR